MQSQLTVHTYPLRPTHEAAGQKDFLNWNNNQINYLKNASSKCTGLQQSKVEQGEPPLVTNWAAQPWQSKEMHTGDHQLIIY